MDIFWNCTFHLITNPPLPSWQLRRRNVLTLLLILKKSEFFLNVLEKCIDAHTYVSTLLNTSPFSCSPCGSQKLLDKIDLWAFFEIEPIILTLWCLRSILGFCWWRLFHIYSHKSTFWCSLPHVRHCIMSWAGCVKIKWNDPVYHNYVAWFYLSSYFYHMLRPP